jgi:DNA/RNA-binding domain of Phe-tRNA-synthetase-like protein
MGTMSAEHALPGWRLVWVRLQLAEPAMATGIRRLAAARARERWSAAAYVDSSVVAAIRRLFREAGADPTRYRPSSEALLRRVLKGEELPDVHPLVDLNNAVSVELAVPCCVMRAGSVGPQVRVRAGTEGERMESLRGDFDLAGKPLLEDDIGPFGTPITDSRRVAVVPSTRAAWMVAYLPAAAGADLVAQAFDALALDALARRTSSWVSE